MKFLVQEIDEDGVKANSFFIFLGFDHAGLMLQAAYVKKCRPPKARISEA